MIVLGLAGHAGAGKDTVADYLVRRYGFMKFAFSDALYREVAAAFKLEDESLLRDRATKEQPIPQLAMVRCNDPEFLAVLDPYLFRAGAGGAGLPEPVENAPLSPRTILQVWGTEYRRAQDPDYWVKRADEWLYNVMAACRYPEHRPQLFVNTTCRFENERWWIHKFTNGQVWHIRREGVGAINAHVSDQPLEVLHDKMLHFDDAVTTSDGTLWAKRCFERVLYNNDSIDRLYHGIELLLSTQAEFVRVEPMYSGPYCCARAKALGTPTCPECEAASAGYSAAASERAADEAHLTETFHPLEQPAPADEHSDLNVDPAPAGGVHPDDLAQPTKE